MFKKELSFPSHINTLALHLALCDGISKGYVCLVPALCKHSQIDEHIACRSPEPQCAPSNLQHCMAIKVHGRKVDCFRNPLDMAHHKHADNVMSLCRPVTV